MRAIRVGMAYRVIEAIGDDVLTALEALSEIIEADGVKDRVEFISGHFDEEGMIVQAFYPDIESERDHMALIEIERGLEP